MDSGLSALPVAIEPGKHKRLQTGAVFRGLRDHGGAAIARCPRTPTHQLLGRCHLACRSGLRLPRRHRTLQAAEQPTRGGRVSLKLTGLDGCEDAAAEDCGVLAVLLGGHSVILSETPDR